MAKQAIGHGWRSVAASALPTAATLLYLIVPLVLVLQSATSGDGASGFALGSADLARLSARSLVLSCAAASAATMVSVTASTLSFLDPRFRAAYTTWLRTLLFVNPVFLVFGFSILLARCPPFAAVLFATAYILVPLCGLIVQARTEQFPREQFLAARSLGDGPAGFTLRHLLPHLLPHSVLAATIGSVYALGFYLVPSYVGLGRVPVLASAIDRSANSVGDWSSASQLALIAMTLGIGLIGAGVLLFWLLQRKN